MSDAPRRGAICTFYSYKGGVGRSMSLANVATLLARWNKRVLVVDWDLEAPGLERFFAGCLRGSRKRTPGLVDLFAARERGEAMDWRRCLLQAAPNVADPIDILHAGLDDEGYVGRMRSIQWDGPAEDGLGDYLETLRGEWKRAYDFILIDSRTGITDVGGICAVHLPDILVALFTTTHQSLDGIVDVLTRTRTARDEMRVNRTKLLMLPVPMRDESGTEYQLARKWRADFSAALWPFMTDWLPKGVTAEDAFNILRVPYVAFWSFGESLPVLKEDADNPKTLAYSFTLVARLVSSRLDWAQLRTGAQAGEESAEQVTRLKERSAAAVQQREAALLLAEQRERERAEKERERFAGVRASIRERLAGLREELGRRVRSAWTWMWIDLVIGAAGAAVAFGYFAAPAVRSRVDALLGNDQAVTAPPLSPALALAVGVVIAAAVAWGLARARHVAAQRGLDMLSVEEAALGGGILLYAGLDDAAAWSVFAGQIEKIARPVLLGGVSFEEAAVPQVMAIERPAPRLGGAASVAPAPAPAEPAGVPAVQEAGLPAAIDVVLVHAGGGVAAPWLREFVPLLALWLGEGLGREPVIHDGGAELGEDVLERSAVAVVVLSRRLLASPDGSSEVRRVVKRFAVGGRVFPIVLDQEESAEVSELNSWVRVSDFSAFAFVGEGFSKSDRYVGFQETVQGLAREIAGAIGRAGERAG